MSAVESFVMRFAVVARGAEEGRADSCDEQHGGCGDEHAGEFQSPPVGVGLAVDDHGS